MMSLRKRFTRVRILTLPKSGTYFLVGVLPRLGIRKLKISHVANEHNQPALKPGHRAAMTIRDPRGFFVSLANWCDIQGARIREGADPVALKMNMRADRLDAWECLGFDEKVRRLVTLDDQALFDVPLIRTYFDCVNLYLDDPRVKTLRFEDMMAWGEDGPSERQVRTIQEMIGFFGLRAADAQVAEAMRATRGKSVTFHRGKPKAWQDDLSPENVRLIEEHWGDYIRRWGYAA